MAANSSYHIKLIMKLAEKGLGIQTKMFDLHNYSKSTAHLDVKTATSFSWHEFTSLLLVTTTTTSLWCLCTAETSEIQFCC